MQFAFFTRFFKNTKEILQIIENINYFRLFLLSKDKKPSTVYKFAVPVFYPVNIPNSCISVFKMPLNKITGNCFPILNIYRSLEVHGNILGDAN